MSSPHTSLVLFFLHRLCGIIGLARERESLARWSSPLGMQCWSLRRMRCFRDTHAVASTLATSPLHVTLQHRILIHSDNRGDGGSYSVGLHIHADRHLTSPNSYISRHRAHQPLPSPQTCTRAAAPVLGLFRAYTKAPWRYTWRHAQDPRELESFFEDPYWKQKCRPTNYPGSAPANANAMHEANPRTSVSI